MAIFSLVASAWKSTKIMRGLSSSSRARSRARNGSSRLNAHEGAAHRVEDGDTVALVDARAGRSVGVVHGAEDARGLCRARGRSRGSPRCGCRT